MRGSDGPWVAEKQSSKARVLSVTPQAPGGTKINHTFLSKTEECCCISNGRTTDQLTEAVLVFKFFCIGLDCALEGKKEVRKERSEGESGGGGEKKRKEEEKIKQWAYLILPHLVRKPTAHSSHSWEEGINW